MPYILINCEVLSTYQLKWYQIHYTHHLEEEKRKQFPTLKAAVEQARSLMSSSELEQLEEHRITPEWYALDLDSGILYPPRKKFLFYI